MAERGRPTAELVLSNDERETLERWARRPKSAQSLALRCRIVLECAKGQTNTVVADRLHVSRATVGKWRKRFIERRLDGLHDEPRPGVPRSVSDEDVERVVVKTLEEAPADAIRSSRLPAQCKDFAQMFRRVVCSYVAVMMLYSLQYRRTGWIVVVRPAGTARRGGAWDGEDVT
jgi:transposase-like protein